jgi:FemAB-related protein (PEP-CTERM system-associated)
MGRELGHDCLYLVARDPGGDWRGVLPLVRVRSPLLGHYLISVPFLNGGGPTGDDQAIEALVQRAVSEAKGSGARLLELRLRVPLAGNDLIASDRKITVVLELPDKADELYKKLHPKIRANIKKALREGVELRFGADQVTAFYAVYSRNMRDLGTPVLPRGFFERIAATFPDTALFAALYLGGVPVCGQCSFVWRDTLEMVWGSSVREYNRFKPTTFVHWAFMELAIERGLRVLDFGRCTPGSGTHQFKKQWGGRDVPLPWRVWSRGGSMAPPTPDRPIFALATGVWRHTPLALANRLGPVIARFLP